MVFFDFKINAGPNYDDFGNLKSILKLRTSLRYSNCYNYTTTLQELMNDMKIVNITPPFEVVGE